MRVGAPPGVLSAPRKISDTAFELNHGVSTLGDADFKNQTKSIRRRYDLDKHACFFSRFFYVSKTFPNHNLNNKEALHG
tara:strand:+ start:1023 stop:1259 length:237 start_codon:yes stop_codon:yes gene_type:complete